MYLITEYGDSMRRILPVMKVSHNAYQLVAINVFLLLTVGIKICLFPIVILFAAPEGITAGFVYSHLITSVVAILLGGVVFARKARKRLQYIKDKGTISSVLRIVLNIVLLPPLFLIFFMALFFINN